MDQRLRSWVTGESDKRDAVNDVSYMWPASDDGTVRVPYTLSDEIQRGKKSFLMAANCISLLTSLRCFPSSYLQTLQQDVFVLFVTICCRIVLGER